MSQMCCDYSVLPPLFSSVISTEPLSIHRDIIWPSLGTKASFMHSLHLSLFLIHLRWNLYNFKLAQSQTYIEPLKSHSSHQLNGLKPFVLYQLTGRTCSSQRLWEDPLGVWETRSQTTFSLYVKGDSLNTTRCDFRKLWFLPEPK